MSSRVLNELENIDDDAGNKDIVMVKVDIDMDDKHILDKFNIPNNLPRLALFEDDHPVQLFEGDLTIEETVLEWLIKATEDEPPIAMNLKKPETPKTEEKPKEAPKAEEPKPKIKKEEPKKEPVAAQRSTQVKDPKPKSKLVEEALEDDEEVSEAEEAIKILNEKRNVVVFFYERLDKVATKIISSLTRVEEHFSGQDLVFINVDINEVKDISVNTAPSLVYFKNGEPEPYADNMMNEEAILAWIEENLRTNQDVIEDLSYAQIKQMVQDREYVLIYTCKF